MVEAAYACPASELAAALALAGGERGAAAVRRSPGGRALTRRGVLWLGQTCNLRCYFCYFVQRVGDRDHPEHAFMSLEKAQRICRVLREHYGNTSVDINGGEPTLFKPLPELVHFCAQIGLPATVITNGVALSRRGAIARLKQAGLRELLVSVHGLGEAYDRSVGVKGAHARQMRALGLAADEGVPVRFNTVLTREAAPQLPAIAELALGVGARAVNFLAFNPFADQQDAGVRTGAVVMPHHELAPFLTEALDRLAQRGLEANVRYLPFCALPERHWPSVHNFRQLPYDTHEWDLASWRWSYLPRQRSRDGEPSPPTALGPALEPGGRLRELFARRVRAGGRLARRAWELWLHTGHRWWSHLPAPRDPHRLYQAHAALSARRNGYRHVGPCRRCDLAPLCDGLHGDYAALFGESEARPIDLGGRVRDARQFVRRQLKVGEPEDPP